MLESIREQKNKCEIVRIKGKFVMSGVKEVRALIMPIIEEASTQRLLLDFAKVEFFDSSAIGLIMSCHKEMARQNAIFGIFACSEYALDIFQKIRLDKILNIYTTEEEALGLP